MLCQHSVSEVDETQDKIVNQSNCTIASSLVTSPEAKPQEAEERHNIKRSEDAECLVGRQNAGKTATTLNTYIQAIAEATIQLATTADGRVVNCSTERSMTTGCN